jgi:hypothetical protein
MAFTLPVGQGALAQATQHLLSCMPPYSATRPSSRLVAPCRRRPEARRAGISKGVQQGGEHRRLGEGAGDLRAAADPRRVALEWRRQWLPMDVSRGSPVRSLPLARPWWSSPGGHSLRGHGGARPEMGTAEARRGHGTQRCACCSTACASSPGTTASAGSSSCAASSVSAGCRRQ